MTTTIRRSSPPADFLCPVAFSGRSKIVAVFRDLEWPRIALTLENPRLDRPQGWRQLDTHSNFPFRDRQAFIISINPREYLVGLVLAVGHPCPPPRIHVSQSVFCQTRSEEH